MSNKPVTAVPAAGYSVRPPPPGCPPGGTYANVKFVGPVSWLVCICIGVCGLICPCDTKEHYIAPDGVHYTVNGTRDDVYGPCKCC